MKLHSRLVLEAIENLMKANKLKLVNLFSNLVAFDENKLKLDLSLFGFWFLAT